eukprot:SM000088S23732  [mRNA]  locus=s88:346692:347961:- [translate_table: standard]
MHKASGVEPRAVGSRSLAKAREFAAEAGLATAYGSYQEVLDDPGVDAVYVPLPTGLHLEWVVKAAAAGKHVLLEKPPATDAAELEEMLAACAEAGVQLMDGTMWMHNPRAAAMATHLDDRSAFGRPSHVNASLSFWAADEFLATNIRCQPGLDRLGCLGDIGWFCIRAALWAFDFDMPHRVAAHPDPKLNTAGVVMSCGATLTWPDGRVAVFDCGFDAPFRQNLEIVGTRAVLELKDFIIPSREDECSFTITSAVALKDFSTWISKEEVNHKVKLRVPQEALMLEKFASLVAGIQSGRGKVDPYWPSIARKTQAVLSTVDQSIKGGSCMIQLIVDTRRPESRASDSLSLLPGPLLLHYSHAANAFRQSLFRPAT